MNRNTQERFALNLVNIDISRSKFIMTPEVKTSFNVGDLIPIGMPIEVLPGDTFEISTSFAVRMQPLVSAPMDNLSFDYYFFFVPNRLVWNHWKEFMGENTESAWYPTTEYTIPQMEFTGGAVPHSVADYMGIPITGQFPETNKFHTEALRFRGFALIYNEWFRNENIIAPLMVHTDDTNRLSPVAGSSDYDTTTTSVELGGILPKVSKRPDYFTKALPGPQKGPDLTLLDHLPVYFGEPRSVSEVYKDRTAKSSYMSIAPNNNVTQPIFNSASSTAIATNAAQPNNWFVDGQLTINALRIAFQVQKLYEKDARGGTRYREMIKSHFGVTSPDASQQIPQYLGGKNIAININSILQTSESANTPQGNVAGYSLTSHGTRGHDFIQSFTEHGYLFCVGCARIDQHSYQNGLHRSWSRKKRLDYYFPVLANISEQPVLNKEIFLTGITNDGTVGPDDEVFGYQEAWAEYRYTPSLLTGSMRSNASVSLDSWHFGDDYSTLPSLSQSWIEEDKANVDRVLAVTSNVSDQLFGDFGFKIKATRPMPMYSIPGLIDHH